MASNPDTARLLRDLRRDQGTTLRSAAADIGVAASQLSRIERGERGMNSDMSLRLSSYYGVSADVILLSQGEIPKDIVQILQENPDELDAIRQRYQLGD